VKGGEVKAEEERGDGGLLVGSDRNWGGNVRPAWNTRVQVHSERKEDSQPTI